MSTLVATKILEDRLAGLYHTNQKLMGADFSNRNGKNGQPPEEFGELSNSDFRNTKLMGACFDGAKCDLADFSYANLTNASFRNASLYKANLSKARLAGCDFEGADIRGITITLTCDTFEAVKLPKVWLANWLYLATLMQIPEDVKLKLEDIIGPSLVEKLREARYLVP